VPGPSPVRSCCPLESRCVLSSGHQKSRPPEEPARREATVSKFLRQAEVMKAMIAESQRPPRGGIRPPAKGIEVGSGDRADCGLDRD